jgi:MOSC domain-containing protein YiiM
VGDARVFQINVSGGGVPKLSVPEAEVGPLGIIGDDHDDKVNHGGPLQALCLYSVDALNRLQAEGHPVVAGGMGENITFEGLDVSDLHPGDQLRIGGIEIEVTSYASPCKTIEGNFMDGVFSRVSPKVHIEDSRLYARIIRGGHIRQGDPVELMKEGSNV